jgi:hypothetical protein
MSIPGFNLNPEAKVSPKKLYINPPEKRQVVFGI